MKKTKIVIDVELDDNHVPEKMFWKAEDGGIKRQETKAAMISVWDSKAMEALRIDLWTKDMEVYEMKRFFIETIAGMADTHATAVGRIQPGIFGDAQQVGGAVGIDGEAAAGEADLTTGGIRRDFAEGSAEALQVHMP